MEINSDIIQMNIPQPAPLEVQAKIQAAVSAQILDMFMLLSEGEGKLAEILTLAGFKPSPENIEMARQMIQNNLPVNDETLKAFNRSVKLMGGDFEKAAFLIKNDIPPTAKNAMALNSFANHETTILNELETLVTLIDELPDKSLSHRLSSFLSGDKPKTAEPLIATPQTVETPEPAQRLLSIEPKALAAKFTSIEPNAFVIKMPETAEAYDIRPQLAAKLTNLPDNEITAQKLEEIVRDVFAEKGIPLEEAVKQRLFKALDIEEYGGHIKLFPREAGEHAAKEPSLRERIIDRFTVKANNREPAEIDKLLNELKDSVRLVKDEASKQDIPSPKILETAEKITRNIDFLNEVKNSVFVQVPVQVGDKAVNAELYVFKDKRQKKGASGGGASALLALDLSALGRFEAYIQKEGKNVSCQFRLGNEYVNTVRDSIQTLASQLSGYGYTLSGLSFKTLEQPFTLLDREPRLISGDRSDFTIGLDVKV